MNRPEKQQRPNRIGSRSDYGTFDPDKLWGQPVPDLTKNDGPDDFEARVERAWRYVQNAFFTAGEHAAMAEAVLRLIGHEAAPTTRRPGREQEPPAGSG